MSDTVDPFGSKIIKSQAEGPPEKGDQPESNQIAKNNITSKAEQARNLPVKQKTTEFDQNGKVSFSFFFVEISLKNFLG